MFDPQVNFWGAWGSFDPYDPPDPTLPAPLILLEDLEIEQIYACFLQKDNIVCIFN